MSLLRSDEIPETPSDQPQGISLSCGSLDIAKQVSKNILEIQENIERPAKKQIRIYLLRHYPKNITTGEYYTNLGELPDDFKKAYDGILSNCQKTLFVYDGATSLPRVQSTAEDILKNYPIPECQIIRDTRLEGSYDEKEDPLERKNRTIEEFRALRKTLQERDLSEIDTIVIISNRTYVQPFDLLSWGNKDITQEALESIGYQFRDFDTSLNPIIPVTTSLTISPEFYKSFWDIFPEFSTSKSCQELQWKIESEFNKKPVLFSKFIAHPSSPSPLRTFCLANLLENNTPESIKSVSDYYKWTTKKVCEQETKILFERRKIEILASLAQRGLIEDINIQNQLSGLIKILDIQTRSLDPKIKNQKEGDNGILGRTLFLVKKEARGISSKQGELGGTEEFVKKPIEIIDILDNKTAGVYVLPAHVWNGKSIWLSDFAKTVILEHPDYDVSFFEWKDFTGDNKDRNFHKLIERLEIGGDKKIIFIDALDEIGDTKMTETIRDVLKKTKNIVVVTGRLSEFHAEENEAFHTLGFYPISKEDFINSRVIDKEKKKEIDEMLKRSHLDTEVELNPLILNFVCIIANANNTKKDEYMKIGVKELNDINNKTELYENIVRLVLVEHPRSKEQKDLSFSFEEEVELFNISINTDLDRLWEIAYELFKRKKDWSEKWLRMPDIIKSLKCKAGDINELNILFRRTESWEYEFIHKSFYEFFLARHFVYMEGDEWNKEITKLRDSCLVEEDSEVNNIILHYIEVLSGREDKRSLFIQLMLAWQKDGEGIRSTYLMFLNLIIFHKISGKINVSDRNNLEQIYINQVSLIWDKIGDSWTLGSLAHMFAENIYYTDSNMLNHIVDRICETGWRETSTIDSLISVWTPYAVWKAIEKIDVLAENRCEFDVCTHYADLLDHKDSLVKIESPLRGLLVLIKNGQYIWAMNVYLKYIKTWLTQYYQEAIKWALLLIEQWEWGNGNLIFLKIIFSGNSEIRQEIFRAMIILAEQWKKDEVKSICLQLFCNLDLHLLSLIFNFAQKNIESEYSWFAIYILRYLFYMSDKIGPEILNEVWNNWGDITQAEFLILSIKSIDQYINIIEWEWGI